MNVLLMAIATMFLSGLAALGARRPRMATRLGSGGVILGSLIGLVPVIRVLASGSAEAVTYAWSVPYGSFAVGIDPLSAFFLLPVLGVSALAALYGTEYLTPYYGKYSVRGHWFFYSLLVASMSMVLVARNAVLFLVAWELMSVASFFLVTFEHHKESVRDAGWTYLVATHVGAAFLLAFFVLLGNEVGSFDFDRICAFGVPTSAGVLFLLSVVGFGAKAGFLPLHVWLPEAHPAAPSHVSALMSGVMIKTGIYGILRTLTFLGPPSPWWGYVLVAIGLTSGIIGVLFALAQHDLKRLLAYHSVENIGIIALGLGVGVIGAGIGSPALIVLGLCGGLLHVLNHAIFKSLLFLGAGSVFHGTGTREIDLLGGLLKRMPWTGVTFLIGAAAICGLPPLNGFVSEFLIYLSAFRGGAVNDAAVVGTLSAVIAGLALIGGLAAACFAKAFGIIFLGEPRSDLSRTHEAGWAMRLPMGVLAAGCVLIGLLAPLTLRLMAPVVAQLAPLTQNTVRAELMAAARPLAVVARGACGLLAMIGALALLRRRLLARRTIGEGVTWDCGYAQPSPRMQYTASSFAQPLTDFFRIFLWTERRISRPSGLFPRSAALHTFTPDTYREKLYAPVFRGVVWGLSRLRWLQHGRVQLYMLYIAVALMALIVWKLG